VPKRGDEYLSSYQIFAYDQEMHGSYSFVKMGRLCAGGVAAYPTGTTLHLALRGAGFSALKVHHEVFLPPSWTARVNIASKAEMQKQEQFYRDVWSNMHRTGQTAPATNAVPPSKPN
jgi:hypothetical protein